MPAKATHLRLRAFAGHARPAGARQCIRSRPSAWWSCTSGRGVDRALTVNGSISFKAWPARTVPGTNARYSTASSAAAADVIQSEVRPAPQANGTGRAEGFSWTKQWWPVSPVACLDTQRPTPVQLLGHDYVLWYDKNTASWSLMQDRCPHRLVPLSQGRIAEDGQLLCSYHGWRFNSQGNCTNIPQIEDPRAQASACSSQRTCVASYPTQVVGGLLFAWLEAGPHARAEAAAKPVAMPPIAEGSEGTWVLSEVPVDFRAWLEQAMDPTHANWLHHTCGFPMSDATPMQADKVPNEAVHLLNGYSWQHGSYSKKYPQLQGDRVFAPPNMASFTYQNGPIGRFLMYASPLQPGVTRICLHMTFGKPSSSPGTSGRKGSFNLALRLRMARFQLLTKWFGHGILNTSPLADQDHVVNSLQVANFAKYGLTPSDYSLFSVADQGVRAANQWFDMAGYDRMWQQRLPGGTQQLVNPSQRVQVFSVWDMHTKHCVQCQQGMRNLARVAQALLTGAVAFAAAALALAATSSGWGPTLLCAAAALGLLLGRQKVLKTGQRCYVSSQQEWEEAGGLSLVPGVPKDLFSRHALW